MKVASYDLISLDEFANLPIYRLVEGGQDLSLEEAVVMKANLERTKYRKIIITVREISI